MSIKLAAWLDQPARGVSLGYFLEGDEQAGQMDLMTPLGSQMARVEWTPQGVWLDDGRTRQAFASLDELSTALFGEALPLTALPWWMQARPAPSSPHEPDTAGTGFTQAGWHIEVRDAAGSITAARKGSPSQRPATIRIHPDR